MVKRRREAAVVRGVTFKEVVVSHRIRSRFSALALVGGLLLVVVSAGLSAAAPAVDGNLESDYASEVVSLNYTRDQGGSFTGALAVLETEDAYYIGFQQSFATKSNTYCERPNAVENCYQNFRHLVSSDYISFEWTLGGRTIYVPVDILRQDSAAPSGFSSSAGGGDGGSVSGIDAAAVQGKSSMDYNLNVLGWTNLDRSPNFAGSNHSYLYPSIAEVRIDKALGQLDSGLDLTEGLVVVVHNSPEAPFTQPARHISISCPGGESTGEVGGNVTLSVATVSDGDPAAGAPILVIVDGVGSVVSVGGTAGDSGTTDAQGEANIVLTSDAAGQSVVTAIWDLDGDGEWDQGIEPSTVPNCPINWTGQAPTFDLSIDKVVDRATASPGDTLTYEIRVDNTGEGTLTNLVITDAIPSGTTYVGGSASDAGNHDATTNTLTWTFASLAPEEFVLVTFQVTINEGAPNQILNVAVATSNEAGPKQDDALTTISVIVPTPTPPATRVLGEQITRPAEQPQVAPTKVAGQLPARTGPESTPVLIAGLALIGLGIAISSPKVTLQTGA